LGLAAGYPLNDPRTTVHVGDVVKLIKNSPGHYDAILLDIDNGPEGMTRKENDWLYTAAGIAAAQAALTSEGILAYWSAGQDPTFTERIKRTGLSVEPVTVRAHRPGKGAKHVIWLAW
jgi:spermidine synthase